MKSGCGFSINFCPQLRLESTFKSLREEPKFWKEACLSRSRVDWSSPDSDLQTIPSWPDTHEFCSNHGKADSTEWSFPGIFKSRVESHLLLRFSDNSIIDTYPWAPRMHCLISHVDLSCEFADSEHFILTAVSKCLIDLGLVLKTDDSGYPSLTSESKLEFRAVQTWIKFWGIVNGKRVFDDSFSCTIPHHDSHPVDERFSDFLSNSLAARPGPGNVLFLSQRYQIEVRRGRAGWRSRLGVIRATPWTKLNEACYVMPSYDQISSLFWGKRCSETHKFPKLWCLPLIQSLAFCHGSRHQIQVFVNMISVNSRYEKEQQQQ